MSETRGGSHRFANSNNLSTEPAHDRTDAEPSNITFSLSVSLNNSIERSENSFIDGLMGINASRWASPGARPSPTRKKFATDNIPPPRYPNYNAMPGGYRLDILSESRPNPNAKNEILVFSSPTGNASENSLDNVSGISAVNGLPRLAIPTIGYHNIGTDDSSDIIMGENTPIEVVRPGFAQEVDADGDTAMEDLDDSDATKVIVAAVESSRLGKLEFNPEISRFDSLLTPRIPFVECVLVVDTCFILSHLHLVNNLVKAYHRWGNVVIIPWTILIELDWLKESAAPAGRNRTTVGMLARRANNWCFEMIAKKEPGIWCQPNEQALENTTHRGDAAILGFCRHLKQNKGYSTVILSNDTKVCIKALAYGVKAVSFIGTPFTADGIMSHLQGGTDDISYRPPGIWSTVSQAENPHEAPSFEAPYYATTPFADKGNAGLHDSIHVGSGKITARHRPRNDQSSQSPVRYHPEHTASECQPDLEPKAAIGFFLLQIESDLVSCLLPLLYQKWLADPEAVSKGIQDPSRVQGLNGVESALWDCLKHNISEILPRDISGEEIELRIKTRDLSDRWISWCQWAVPGQANQSHRAIKPNPEDLSSFLDAWTTIWQGILKFSVNYRSDYGTYARTTWNWKALAKSVGEHLV